MEELNLPNMRKHLVYELKQPEEQINYFNQFNQFIQTEILRGLEQIDIFSLPEEITYGSAAKRLDNLTS